jgi:hypothetical protein
VCAKDPTAVINRFCWNELGSNDWLILDSMTQISSDANAAVIHFILKDASTPDDFVLDKSTGGKDFKYPMAISMMLDRICSALQNAPFNAAVISHEVMTEQVKDTGVVVKVGENAPGNDKEVIFPAAGSRNFSRQFGRYFDMLIHLDIVNKRHRAFSSSTYNQGVQTGSRLGFNIEEIATADGKGMLEPFDAIVEMLKRAKATAIPALSPVVSSLLASKEAVKGAL